MKRQQQFINDSGVVVATVSSGKIEMRCTKGCDTPSFLRGTIVSERSTSWEFWTQNGVSSRDCPNDAGWQSVELTVSANGRRIDFWYYTHVKGNFSREVRAAPVMFVVTRD